MIKINSFKFAISVLCLVNYTNKNLFVNASSPSSPVSVSGTHGVRASTPITTVPRAKTCYICVNHGNIIKINPTNDNCCILHHLNRNNIIKIQLNELCDRCRININLLSDLFNLNSTYSKEFYDLLKVKGYKFYCEYKKENNSTYFPLIKNIKHRCFLPCVNNGDQMVFFEVIQIFEEADKLQKLSEYTRNANKFLKIIHYFLNYFGFIKERVVKHYILNFTELPVNFENFLEAFKDDPGSLSTENVTEFEFIVSAL